MKLVSFKINEVEKFGVVKESGKYIWNLEEIEKKFDQQRLLPQSVLKGLQQGVVFTERVQELISFGESCENLETFLYSWNEVTLQAPIPKPEKNIMCVGKNYRDHAIEMGSEADIPEHIMIFTKAPTTVIGTGSRIHVHSKLTSQLDYEGELAIIIGKKGINISEEEAPDYVFGYSILNDITARDLQKKHKQFFLGKSLDTTCPLGPYIVTADELPKPGELAIKTHVNGELRQNGNTKDMIFSVDRIISELSAGMTLEPGDIIATGTPSGVGKGFTPPKFLKSGDKIEISVEGIGILENTVE